MSDGISRAPAFALHCVETDSAVPCGILSNPIIVGLPSGSATSVNQASEILSTQAISSSIGSPSDSLYKSGDGSTISILKALLAQLSSGVNATPSGGNLTSRSMAIPAQLSQQLFPANPMRRYLAFQVPQGSGVWLNLMGGVAANGGVDCAYFGPGTFYESSQFVNRGPITVFSSVSATISAWED
jgi:hypothetical protein